MSAFTYFKKNAVDAFTSEDNRMMLKTAIEQEIQKIDPYAEVSLSDMYNKQKQMIGEIAQFNLPLQIGDEAWEQYEALNRIFIRKIVGEVKEYLVQRMQRDRLNYEDQFYQITPFSAKVQPVEQLNQKRCLKAALARDPQYDQSVLANRRPPLGYYYEV